ncbi:MAG: hypothetical protein HUU47_02575 [Bacteroidetes bacterium]|nr:hypothetical protein [Bacteroidota bacterium]
MLLNIVTDEELLTSQIVKTILLVLVSLGIVYNIFRIIRSQTKVRKIINFSILGFLLITIVIVLKEYKYETTLLKHPLYVEGTTIGYCSVFGRGEGIEFEYEIDGIKYRCCNTYHPVSRDSIVVPGGKYKVRYTKKYLNKGRMVFKKTNLFPQ